MRIEVHFRKQSYGFTAEQIKYIDGNTGNPYNWTTEDFAHRLSEAKSITIKSQFEGEFLVLNLRKAQAIKVIN
mgnify:CR=1 FL=1